MNREHNISEAARIVGVTRQRLHQLIRAGHGPECAYPSPRHPVILDDDLRRWMRTRRPVNGRPKRRV